MINTPCVYLIRFTRLRLSYMFIFGFYKIWISVIVLQKAHTHFLLWIPIDHFRTLVEIIVCSITTRGSGLSLQNIQPKNLRLSTIHGHCNSNVNLLCIVIQKFVKHLSFLTIEPTVYKFRFHDVTTTSNKEPFSYHNLSL